MRGRVERGAFAASFFFFCCDRSFFAHLLVPFISQRRCPAGFYCEAATGTPQKCTEGYFCPEGSVAPVKCIAVLQRCEAGSEKPHGAAVAGFATVMVLIVVGFVAYRVSKHMVKEHQRAREGKRRAAAVALSSWNKQQVDEYELATSPRGGRERRPKQWDVVRGAAIGRLRAREDTGARRRGAAVFGVRKAVKKHAKRIARRVTGRKSAKRRSRAANSGPIIEPKDFRMEMKFTNMGLALKKGGHKVLHGVTGTVRHSCLTAVMGPSGAGKTTFLNTISGKAFYGNRTGELLINGRPDDLDKFSKIAGFVPQDDIMLKEMTVKEILWFYATLRLPRSWPRAKKKKLVHDVMRILGLSDIRHSRIGDETARGISGGQRKRVNVGMELVGDPTLLFLDEPTSGLDSTTSFELLQALQQVARQGVTIVTVLHQPSWGIYCMFDARQRFAEHFHTLGAESGA